MKELKLENKVSKVLSLQQEEEISTEEKEEELDVLEELMNTPLAFQEKRHQEEIKSAKVVAQTWRMKERMKTISVALVLCLNVGVDPPDVVKTTPCARKECWIDPLSHSLQKALETVGGNLQKQYERWQPRARYKQSLDPTVEDVKKLCTSLRRNAKEERVLFHYNGHGVPRPTVNGEIWVFNKTYTQYIPLSIYDLQTWMGSPSIFVFDCSSAGLIVSSFKTFADQRERDMQGVGLHSPSSPICDAKNCIQLAACSADELLPMNPELPADLFTSCLTTPIKIALQWFCHQRLGSLAPGVTLDLIEKIPGQLNDRRTPLGELNWIFTAITDTIAWNTLPRELFQKLFRQDLLVASLFRNFLLADRIMRSYRCTPFSQPALPPTFRHPMWNAWDHAVDVCLSQLPQMLGNQAQKYTFKNSPFFAQQLTAFQVWLSLGVQQREPPQQLPIVLQVLLSQVHRLRALDLLGRFLDLGSWAVSLALSVGIFPYVLKLLQSLAKELRPLLVFIWAKILAVDSTCQSDLVKDEGHHYFLRALQDPLMPLSRRTMAAFVLAEIVNKNLAGQEQCLKRNIISSCLDQLDDESMMVTSPQLKQWVAICLGRVWTSYDEARWRGVRDRAHVRLYELLEDPHPEVRTAAVYALGTFVDNKPDTGSDHAAHVNQAVGATLTLLYKREASMLVRRELTIALQRRVSCYDSSFAAIAFRFVEEEQKSRNKTCNQSTPSTRSSRSSIDQNSLPANFNRQGSGDSNANQTNNSSQSSSFSAETNMSTERLNRLRKISVSSLPSNSGIAYSSVNANIWKVLLSLATDPHPIVAGPAKSVVASVMERVAMMAHKQSSRYGSTPNSPKNQRKNSESLSLSSVSSSNASSLLSPLKSDSIIPMQLTPFPRSRKSYSKEPERNREIFRAGEVPSTIITLVDERLVSTEFCEWSSCAFAQPTKDNSKEEEKLDVASKQRNKFEKLLQIENNIGISHLSLDPMKMVDQQFYNKNPHPPSSMIFHPYNNNLIVGGGSSITVWNWEGGTQKHSVNNNNPQQTNISCMQFINQHSDSMLMVGTDDGCVRVWKDICHEKSSLVTAWQAMSDNVASPRGSGMVVCWDQEDLHLYAGGDSRKIHVWSTTSERKEQEFLTGADSSVTSLVLNKNYGFLVGSFGDGSLRIFDGRVKESTYKPIRAHETWIINSTFLQDNTLLTASELGDVKLWDVRMWASDVVKSFKVKSGGIRHLKVHPKLPIIACSSFDHSLNYLNMNGEELGTVRYYDGFLGQRIGVITSMCFHPLLANLAVGTADSFVTVYSAENKT